MQAIGVQPLSSLSICQTGAPGRPSLHMMCNVHCSIREESEASLIRPETIHSYPSLTQRAQVVV
jgi:hypothetical protein